MGDEAILFVRRAELDLVQLLFPTPEPTRLPTPVTFVCRNVELEVPMLRKPVQPCDFTRWLPAIIAVPDVKLRDVP